LEQFLWITAKDYYVKVYKTNLQIFQHK